MDRRNFIKAFSAGTAGLAVAPQVFADGFEGSRLYAVPTNLGITGNVTIIGGGMAGATLAKYLRLWGGTGVAVTLIEKAAQYTSNIMSNTVLNGQRTVASLYQAYDTLANHYGVNVVQAEVASIDAGTSTLTLADSSTLTYERLVVAPGIEFDLFPGMTSLDQYETLVPHAWQAGPQTQLLRDQLVAMTAGDTVVLAIPKSPYRCPPGPYERSCVIADWLKTNKPGSKLIVLDGNADIVVEKENFSHAFNVTHAGIVDYRPGCTITNLDPVTRTVTYDDASGTGNVVTAAVLNPIPSQRAPDFLAAAGLFNALEGERFAPVSVLSYESTRISGIHVLGDASKTTQPKAGHIANQEAKTCADAIVRALQGIDPDPAPVTNSACFTPITSTTATWLSAVYQYDAASGNMVVPAQHNSGKAIAATSATTRNYQEMLVWFDTLMADSFR